MDINELRVILADYEQSDDDYRITFDFARSLDSDDLYVDAIICESDARGVLWAAAADVADAVGECDYDEAVLEMIAAKQRWKDAADALPRTDRGAKQVRVAAAALLPELDRDDMDLEMLPDLITICVAEAALGDHSATLQLEDERNSGDHYLSKNAEDIAANFRLLCALKADLRDRGELALDDEILPENE